MPLPVLGLSTSSVSFAGAPGGPDPVPQAITVSNLGGSKIHWTATEIPEVAWLTLTDGSGGGGDAVTLSVSTGALAAGTYATTVEIRDLGATNSPLIVNVTLAVRSRPTVALSAVSIDFAATEGGADPAPQPVTVTDSNTGANPIPLSWTAIEAPDAAWLTLTDASGGDGDAVTLSAMVGSLAAGTYTATVEVGDPNAGNSPQTVDVTLTVQSRPAIALSAATIDFTATEGGGDPAPQFLTVTDSNAGANPIPLSWIAVESPDVAWLTLANASGGDGDAVTLSVATSSLPAGTYAATVDIADSNASDTPVSIAVDLTITAANTPPTVATPASASPNPVSADQTTLSVLGADDGGEAALSYTWATTGSPPALVTFTANDTNVAKTTIATFTMAGSYSFAVTIEDGDGLTVIDTVDVTVNQTVTSIAALPASADVTVGEQQQFTASATDQFGDAMAATSTWSVDAAAGTIDATGLFTAGASAGGPYTVTASSGSVDGTASVNVAGSPPTVATPASATPNPVTTDQTTLSVLGADDGGEATLSYTWATTGSPPAPVTFSVTGTNAAKTTVATFTLLGGYSFIVTIEDGDGLTVTDTVDMTVSQTVTSVTVLPASADVAVGEQQLFAASANDQFGDAMATTFAWSVDAAAGTIDSAGLFTAGALAGGPYTVTASNSGVDGTASVSVIALPPTVATPVSASPNPVTADQATLSVLGADDSGEAALTYTWATTGMPPAPVAFSVNGTNAAKTTVATFTMAGDYSFAVTIEDADGLTVTDTVDITVSQTLMSITVLPASADVVVGEQQQFTVSATDQFGDAMAATFTWSVDAAAGAVDTDGLFTAAASEGGPYVLTASSGSVDGTASVSVVALPPTVATPASASPNPVVADQTTLSVLGADDGGEATLTYTWATSGSPPAPVTFGANGTNAAKAMVATFTMAGDYSFVVTIQDGFGLTVTDTVDVTVSQTAASVMVLPASADVTVGEQQQFTATATDQFGDAMAATSTWSVDAAAGTIDSAGLFTAGASAGGPYTVTASSGGVDGAASITVVGSPPTVATPASATPNPVTADQTTLSVLGADDGGEATLSYTWATTGSPPAPVTFSVTGTNAAKTTVATFTLPGGYSFIVTIEDGGGLTVTDTTDVTVDQTVTSVTVLPASADVVAGEQQQFTASATGQFGDAMATTFAWSIDAAAGTIDSAGLFTAGASVGGPYTVTASSGGVDGTALVSVLPPPEFSLSTGSLTFAGVQYDPNPPDQLVQLGNGGDGGTTLAWTATSDASWLSVSPGSGTTTMEVDTLTVSVDVAGLVAGTHTGAITLSDPGASNDPQTITVGLDVAPADLFTDTDAGLIDLMKGAAAWGDWDADGDLDLVITGTTKWDIWSRRSLRYENTGGGFSLLAETLPKVADGHLAWGDTENDGDIDLGITGSEGASNYDESVSQVWNNDGTGVLSYSGISFGSRSLAAWAWCDYDNDGRQDVFSFGATAFDVYEGKLFRNTGGAFTDTGAILPACREPRPALGDFDNDGDNDLFLSGRVSAHPVCENVGGGVFSENQILTVVSGKAPDWVDIDNDGDLDLSGGGVIYRNNGDKTFTQLTILVLGWLDLSAWGDYNNDGNVDVATRDRIYFGDGAGGFSQTSIALLDSNDGCIACGDYDGDGDLDLAVVGGSNGFPFAAVYRNNCETPNAPPSAPGGLAASILGIDATLSWAAATDDHTPSAGLSYNIRVGTTPDGNDVASGMSRLDGRRLIPALGNAQKNLSWKVKDLAAGTYYWSVQAIDTSFLGSQWATEGQFVVTVAGTPDISLHDGSWNEIRDIYVDHIDGETAPADRSFWVGDSGSTGTVLSWSATDDVPPPSWLSYDPASGEAAAGASTEVVLSFEVSTLSPGVYVGTITVSGSERDTSVPAASGDRTVKVHLTVKATGLEAAPAGLAFEDAVEEVSNPAPDVQTVTLTNAGAAAADWTTSVAYDQPVAPWLSVAASGTVGALASEQVTVAAVPVAAGLPGGTYSATIDFVDAAAPAAPQSVAITLVVKARGEIAASVSVLTFICPTGDTSSFQYFDIVNAGTTGVAWVTSDDAAAPDWLSVTASGSTEAGSSSVLTANVDTSGLAAASTHSATIAISATDAVGGQGAKGSPQTVDVTLIVQSQPVIDLDTTALTFTAVEGEANPSDEVVVVTDINGGPNPLALSWTAVEAPDVAWLTLTNASGLSGDSMTLSAATGALAAGTYVATVEVSDSAATNSPQTVDVSFVVQSRPAASLSKAAIVFTAVAGEADPPSEVVTVTDVNTGANPLATLAWTAAETPDAAWLSIADASGVSGDAFTLSASTGSLVAGNYVATVQVSDPNASNDPQNLGVTLVVQSRPVIDLSSSTVTFTMETGRPPDTQMITVNDGNAAANGIALAWTASESPEVEWLALSTASGGAGISCPSTSLR